VRLRCNSGGHCTRGRTVPENFAGWVVNACCGLRVPRDAEIRRLYYSRKAVKNMFSPADVAGCTPRPRGNVFGHLEPRAHPSAASHTKALDHSVGLDKGGPAPWWPYPRDVAHALRRNCIISNEEATALGAVGAPVANSRRSLVVLSCVPQPSSEESAPAPACGMDRRRQYLSFGRKAPARASVRSRSMALAVRAALLTGHPQCAAASSPPAAKHRGTAPCCTGAPRKTDGLLEACDTVLAAVPRTVCAD